MAKKKKRPRKPQNTSLNIFLKAFKSTKKPWDVISNHRKLLSKSDFTKVWEGLALEHHRFKYLEKFILPKDKKNLFTRKCLKGIGAKKELEWFTEQILFFAPQINIFLEEAKLFEDNLRSQNYNQARDVLVTLDKNVCVSFWSLERQVGLEQKIGGFEGNKKFIESEFTDDECSPILLHLIQNVSVRNEESTAITWQSREYKKAMSEGPVKADLLYYLQYKLFRPVITEFDADSILQREDTSSIIDLYESFVFVLSQKIHTLDPAKLLILVDKVSTKIKDQRLDKIKFLLSGDVSHIEYLPVNEQIVSNLLRKEDSALALDAAYEVIRQPNVCLATKIAASKAIFDLEGISTVDDQFIDTVLALLRKESEFYDAYNMLILWSVNCSPRNHEFVINNLLKIEFSNIPIDDENKLDVMEFIYSSYLCYSHIPVIPSVKCQSSLLLVMNERTTSVYTKLYYNSIFGSAAELPESKALHSDYFLLLQLQKLSSREKGDELELARELYKSRRIRMRRYAGRYLAQKLIADNNLGDLYEFVGQCLSSDQGAKFTLPIIQIGEGITKEVSRKFHEMIELSIILSFVKEFTVNNDDRRLLYAYEDYLRSLAVSVPSKLDFATMCVEKPKLVYFLRHVCSIETMMNSTAFHNVREVEDERIKVCSYLLSLDTNNSTKYNDEIEIITKKQAVNDVISQVEQSKIYVDTEKLKANSIEKLKPKFSRYISYIKAGIGDEVADFSDKVMASFVKKEDLSDKFLGQAPKTEKQDILVEMLRELLQKFFLDSLNGLDSFLSVRIRHGAISSQLREPFSENGIITQRNINFDDYDINTKWEAVFSHDEEIQNQLNNYLIDFSKKVDLLIDFISKEKIQIRTETHPDGLIVASLNDVQVRLIDSDVNEATTLEEFIDQAFDMFWSVTESGLAEIRSFIKSEASVLFDNLFHELDRDLNKFGDRKLISGLFSDIRQAKIEMSQALSKFEDWFRLTSEDSDIRVSFDDIATAVLTSVKRSRNKDFEPKINFQGTGDIGVYSKQISFFNDIFFILFDNVMKHSGLSGEFNIHLEREYINSELMFVVENDLSSNINADNLELELEKISTLIKCGDYIGKINKEGKSGLLKLMKLLSSSSDGFDPCLSFSVSEDSRRFKVAFKIKVIGGMGHESTFN